MRKLKTGDKVVVVSGSNKGKEGKITKIVGDRVVVEGVNIVKKHLKPKNNNGNGEIIEVEAPIHGSNVMLLDPKTKKPTKVKVEKDSKGKKIRISKKSNEKID
ncbi:MAG: 50S ribosomal protein L24 [Bacilli bacterium]